MKYVAASAVLGLAGAASANFDMAMQSVSFAGGQFTDTFMFMRAGEFSTLPLKGVIFELDLTATDGQFAVDNDGDEGGTVTVSYGATAVLSSDDITIPAISVNPVEIAMFDLAPDDGDHMGGPPVFDVGGPDYAELPPLAGQNDNFNESLAPAFVAQFAGEGIFDVEVDVSQAFSITGLGAVAFSGSLLQVEGFLKITYLYAPAPGAMALMGLAGLTGIRRRRA